jgi:protein-tyrosine phosphatase
MAEAYLRHRLKGMDLATEVRVRSCGVLGILDDAAAPGAVAVAAQEGGLDLTAHRSRGVAREEIEDADVILVMETSHRRFLGTFYPAHVSKVRLLSEFAPARSGVSAGEDIFDPIGMDLEAFRSCFQKMRSCLDAFVSTLLE